MSGFIYNAKSMSWNKGFSMTSGRVGVGLGGGIGAVAVFAFNTPSLGAMDGVEITDWGVNISLGPNTSALFKAVAKSGLIPSDLENIRQGLHYLYNLNDIASMNGAPTIVAFDLPGGWAYEISVNYVCGTFEIDWEAE